MVQPPCGWLRRCRASVSRPLNPKIGSGSSATMRSADGWLVVDLGAHIGSLRWFRGLFTCTALCVGAASLAPGLAPIEGFVPPAYTPMQGDEAAAQAIAPLALGGDTGRRMVATSAVQKLADTPERPQISLDATLGQGDGFAHALARAGLGEDDVDQVVDLVSDAVKPRRHRARHGDQHDARPQRPSRNVARPLDRLDLPRPFRSEACQCSRVAGALTLIREPIAVDDTPLRIEGRVGGGLYLAARAAGARKRRSRLISRRSTSGCRSAASMPMIAST